MSIIVNDPLTSCNTQKSGEEDWTPTDELGVERMHEIMSVFICGAGVVICSNVEDNVYVQE